VQAASGNRAEAAKLVHQVEEIAKRRYVCDYEIAQVYTVLDEKDQAFRWLKLGEEQQCDCMVWLKSEPWMNPLSRSALPRIGEAGLRPRSRTPCSLVFLGGHTLRVPLYY
jgi:hypothetical protein